MSEATPQNSLREYAAFLETCLRDRLNIAPPSNLQAIFVSNARRLSPTDYEDLGSLILVECQEKLARGEPIDGTELTRIIDRLRHRMARSARREIPLDIARYLPSKSSLSPDQATNALREFVAELTPTEAIVFERRCLHDQSAGEIAKDTGLSQATIYRLLSSVRNKFRAFID
ncbi:MAG: sigma-70 family RNA polymerase sigma factor [Planctomycetota bacterium]|nr:sigma-70 family RNA polymerase sigma factor [Planctomycetota bacterium]